MGRGELTSGRTSPSRPCGQLKRFSLSLRHLRSATAGSMSWTERHVLAKTAPSGPRRVLSRTAPTGPARLSGLSAFMKNAFLCLGLNGTVLSRTAPTGPARLTGQTAATPVSRKVFRSRSILPQNALSERCTPTEKVVQALNIDFTFSKFDSFIHPAARLFPPPRDVFMEHPKSTESLWRDP